MTVDEISGGRVTFGVGAGWTRREHEAYSWELYDPKTRVDRFEEALEIWDLLQSKERVTYLGKHYELIDAPFEPKSSQGKLPVLIGGTKPRMMRLVAKYADIWNSVGDLDEAGTASKNLDKACLEIGRDPATIVRSVSPARVFLESPAKFEEHFHAYRALGFTDFRLPWPRNPGQKEVFDEVVVDLLPKLRQAS
ncbi:MAG: LLM class flavin-dependent oxidoreductase [Thermomicrobiales bacterium]